MSRPKEKPSNAQQRDAELARAEAELKAAREQLAAVKAEINRSRGLLAELQSPGEDAIPQQFDGAVVPLPMERLRQ